MLSKRCRKLAIAASVLLSVFFLSGAVQGWAFSVDVKKLYYADNMDPATVKRVVDYDFSAGTLTENTVTIPTGAVTVRPPSDTDLSYTFGPYPDPGNDIGVALDTGAMKATLTSAVQGGCILSTVPDLPTPASASVLWEFAVRLANFSGMTDDAKTYSAQIGFGSQTPGPQPEFTALWVPDSGGRLLVLQAAIYNDGTDQDEWSLVSAPIAGIDPAFAELDLRVRTVPMGGYRGMIFEYRLSEAGSWVHLATHAVLPPTFPDPPRYLGFPEAFPYVALDTGEAGTIPDYIVSFVNNKITVVQGQSAEFVLGVRFNDYASAQGVGFAADDPGLGALFYPVPVKDDGGAVMKIDTSALAAGVHPANVRYGEGTPDAGSVPFVLEVLSVADIKFFEHDGGQKNYISAKTVNFQGQFGEGGGVSCEVWTSDGRILSGAEAGVTLTSLNPAVLGAYLRYWGYDLYALANGAAVLRAEAPDGTFRDLNVTVAIPQDAPQITAIGLSPAVVSNKGTEEIAFYATSNEAPNRIQGVGADMSGYINLSFDFVDNVEYSPTTVNTRADSLFHIVNPPADLGSAVLSASAARDGYGGTSTAAVLLTTVNDPTYSGLRVAVKSMDPTLFAGDMFDLEFYTSADAGVPAFTKTVFSMQTGLGLPIDVGGIAPGTYKIRFVPSTLVLPQWWPNAEDAAGAQSLDFTAGQFVEDVVFFSRPVPTLSFSGTIRDTANSPVTGASVDVLAGSWVPGTVSADGAFSLAGIPAGQNFELAITKTGFVSVYSQIFNTSRSIQTLLPYRLFPEGALGSWGVAAGNGAVFGRVTQLGNPAGFLSGATVTAVNDTDNNVTYPVAYQNPADGSFGGTATYENGVYAVLNVPDNVTVKITASKQGWVFDPSVWVKVRGDAVGEASFFGTAVSAAAEETAVRSNFQQIVDAFDSQDIDRFMAFVSDNYLDDGVDKTALRAEILSEFGAPLPGYAMAVSIDGNAAAAQVDWADGDSDTFYWIKEADVWRLYGNQLPPAPAPLKGDVDDDGKVDTADAVLVLQVIDAMDPAAARSDYAASGVDVNGDGSAGLAEAVYILQQAAGVRGAAGTNAWSSKARELAVGPDATETLVGFDVGKEYGGKLLAVPTIGPLTFGPAPEAYGGQNHSLHVDILWKILLDGVVIGSFHQDREQNIVQLQGVDPSIAGGVKTVSLQAVNNSYWRLDDPPYGTTPVGTNRFDVLLSAAELEIVDGAEASGVSLAAGATGTLAAVNTTTTGGKLSAVPTIGPLTFGPAPESYGGQNHSLHVDILWEILLDGVVIGSFHQDREQNIVQVQGIDVPAGAGAKTVSLQAVNNSYWRLDDPPYGTTPVGTNSFDVLLTAWEVGTADGVAANGVSLGANDGKNLAVVTLTAPGAGKLIAVPTISRLGFGPAPEAYGGQNHSLHVDIVWKVLVDGAVKTTFHQDREQNIVQMQGIDAPAAPGTRTVVLQAVNNSYWQLDDAPGGMTQVGTNAFDVLFSAAELGGL